MSAKWSLPLALLAVGLVLKFGGPLAWVCAAVPSFRSPLCWGPALVGNIVYITGCFLTAQAKGRSRWWGLSGFLCVLALPILARLENRAWSRMSIEN